MTKREITKFREITTSIHGQGFAVCGLLPQPSEEPVRLDRDYHPGFGGLTLIKNGIETIWSPNPASKSKQLSWIDKHILDDEATWTLEIDGPMVSFTLIRRSPGVWVVHSSRMGFA